MIRLKWFQCPLSTPTMPIAKGCNSSGNLDRVNPEPNRPEEGKERPSSFRALLSLFALFRDPLRKHAMLKQLIVVIRLSAMRLEPMWWAASLLSGLFLVNAQAKLPAKHVGVVV